MITFAAMWTSFYWRRQGRVSSLQVWLRVTCSIAGSSGEFSEQQLVVTLIDFFTGGSGTMSKTLAWALLFCLHNPTVMDKAGLHAQRSCCFNQTIHRKNLKTKFSLYQYSVLTDRRCNAR